MDVSETKVIPSSAPQERLAIQPSGRVITMDAAAKLIAVLAPFLFLLPAFIYALGWASVASFWSELGFVESMATDSFHGYVTRGMLVLLSVVSDYLTPQRLLISGVIASLYAAVVLALYGLLRVYITQFRLAIQSRQFFNEEKFRNSLKMAAVILAPGLLVTISGLALLLLSLVFVVPVLFSVQSGKSDAAKVKSALTSGGKEIARYPVVEYQLGAEATQRGRLIECNALWCLVIVENSVMAIPLKSLQSVHQARP